MTGYKGHRSDADEGLFAATHTQSTNMAANACLLSHVLLSVCICVCVCLSVCVEDNSKKARNLKPENVVYENSFFGFNTDHSPISFVTCKN